ncbi:hypothetical protein CONCODRAFT_15657 [Conidiobolus coronatus NRRL 28638]|uniref:DNA-directed DNA polymerase n=1 Tax=Conidiobolus coronatus (strain ATCC 28846 / CBS 209.66 / NRRL 28638) TaxID=796925 RepID=A0A137PDU1_CONC2|nr:hypothetical protein CONCODRAFT_15657 [Conidiobolus coronatus NRRL 28638]|eukprot:KXN73169.1 hypothetical protein CONCODRAFT_15657 [Conidiobolus coronatus NRRL 28638]
MMYPAGDDLVHTLIGSEIKSYKLKDKDIKICYERNVMTPSKTNSVYGAFGAPGLLYIPYNAATVTRVGRELLPTAIKIIQDEFKMNVIYGDTDSCVVEGDAISVNVIIRRVCEETSINMEFEKKLKSFILRYGTIHFTFVASVYKEAIQCGLDL